MAFHELWDQKFELSPGKWVFVPSVESRERGKYIVSEIKKKWEAPSYFYHCHRGGHVEAVKKHLTHTYLCCIDIENFFTSINRSRVTRTLKKYFGYKIAREFAKDSVIRLSIDSSSKCILPFGFLQSPIIASICLHESALGDALNKLALTPNLIVSVYVDDIIISCNDLHLLQKQFEYVITIAKKSGWKISDRKTIPPGNQISVFNIEMSCGDLSISSERMSLFYKAYHDAISEHQKEGILRYIRSINPEQVDFL